MVATLCPGHYKSLFKAHHLVFLENYKFARFGLQVGPRPWAGRGIPVLFSKSSIQRKSVCLVRPSLLAGYAGCLHCAH